MPDSVPHICILTNMSIDACRNKLRGVLRYERLYGPWRLHLLDLSERESFSVEYFSRFDGIITNHSQDQRLDAIFSQCKMPMVLLDYPESRPPFRRFGQVRCDGASIGRMGAEHLLQRGFTHFAFVSDLHNEHWSQARERAFAGRLTERGFSLSDTFRRANRKLEPLQAWLKKLPKPLGVMAACDSQGHRVILACQMAGIRVPEDVAVVAVDNDEVICQASSPTLSSIVNDNEQGGYCAAEMLSRLLRREKLTASSVFYPPLRVYARQSTAFLNDVEPFVVQALQYITLHGGIGVTVAEIARHLGVSRRLLEMRFREGVGHPVLEEIHNVRFQKIATLLLETNLSVAEIAQLCGFQNSNYLSYAFKNHTGKTISQYRRDRK